MFDKNEKNFAVLTFEQVKPLNTVLQSDVSIHGRGNFPNLETNLTDLILAFQQKLQEEQVEVKDIKLNGGAASYILATKEQSFNDVDLIFNVDLSCQKNFDRVKTAVLSALLRFLPEGVNRNRMSTGSMKEGYVNKMVKVNDSDKWSLISLSNNLGRNVDIKFVNTMKRQFEFSVDSFQILLDSILLFYGYSEMPMSDKFYPTVIVESVYGDFRTALEHLHKRQIATKNPEQIRGGGLLKFCYLLVKGYKAASKNDIHELKRYMCSRFFIDFPDIRQQQVKLEAYLWNHFQGPDSELRYDYLRHLHRVVDQSTVCLMNHERRQTLNLIDQLANQFATTNRSTSPAGSCCSSNGSSCCNGSGCSACEVSTVTAPPPVIYSNGFYYAPLFPGPPGVTFQCTCAWAQ